VGWRNQSETRVGCMVFCTTANQCKQLIQVHLIAQRGTESSHDLGRIILAAMESVWAR
jgi:hypothetical protein